MENKDQIKQIVREKYADIAKKSKSGCGCGCSDSSDLDVFHDDYKQLEGYLADADLNLGCGLPTKFAGIKKGNTVVDLGSGAGNDVFVARAIVGETGRVIGIDMTDEMLKKAEQNNSKLGYKNVDFKLGEIENMPLEANSADVVVSNCVINLVPDKQKAFSEIYRILKPGGHFCISDIVLEGELTESLRKSAEAYAGCVSGALQMSEYLNVIKQSRFKNIKVNTKKKIILPESLLNSYLSESDINDFESREIGIYSITVSAKK